MTATSPTTSERRAALAAFYTAHQHRLARRVHGRAHRIGEDTIADACAYAWLQLVRRPDIDLDLSGFAWLTVVAAREAWRLADITRERPAGALLPQAIEDGELPEPAGPASDPLELVLAAERQRERVERFAPCASASAVTCCCWPAATAIGSYTEFTYQLELRAHNQVHNWCNGTITAPPTAAQDPIFWLLHANVVASGTRGSSRTRTCPPRPARWPNSTPGPASRLPA